MNYVYKWHEPGTDEPLGDAIERVAADPEQAAMDLARVEAELEHLRIAMAIMLESRSLARAESGECE